VTIARHKPADNPLIVTCDEKPFKLSKESWNGFSSPDESFKTLS
jgi:hypothetical protein